MNKYPAWLNVLVLVILLLGGMLALPNIYGSAPAVQLADVDGVDITQTQLDNYVRVLENDGITPEAAYLSDGRAVIRFAKGAVADQQTAGERLRARYENESTVALTLAPNLPEWLRDLGLRPLACCTHSSSGGSQQPDSYDSSAVC